MNLPTPAIVTQRAVRRLPRIALVLLCAAYVLPGVFGRDPWRSDDVTAFGYMYAIATGKTAWLAPHLLNFDAEGGLIPYWLGAAFIKALPFLNAPMAARLPFALLLIAVLVLTWYACYYLARTEPAQPVAFAFGGEATPKDYARAMADGGLLALMATLGLLQPGHETTPQLVQMSFVAFYFFGIAACPFRPLGAPLTAFFALPLLALSGAPTLAAVLGLGGAILCARSQYEKARHAAITLGVGTLLAISLSWASGAWNGIVVTIVHPLDLLLSFLREAAWYTWPAWPLMCWTLWRWRHHLLRRHISVPLFIVVTSIVAALANQGDEEVLMYALPAMATLAAFALPTLKRSATALIDWFALILFTLLIATGWFYWYVLMTGHPAGPSAKLARLVPGFEPHLSWPALCIAVAGTVAWIALVAWRTGRHSHPIWKSMVLSASGVTLIWMMVMTLGLSAMDYARSYRPMTQKITAIVGGASCLATQNLTAPQVASWTWQPGIALRPADADCPFLLVYAPPAQGTPVVDDQRWEVAGSVIRAGDRTRQERVLIYRRRSR